MDDNLSAGLTCLLNGLFILIAVVIAALCTDYVLQVVLHTNLPFWADALIGVVGSEITIPAVIIVFILSVIGAL
jgi:hypothetical protein